MAAAPADFQPVGVAPSKIKKANGPSSIPLAPTTDILASTKHARRNGAVIVGFALETDDVVENGRTKLASKDLDMIVVNDATESGAGFGVDTNRVTLLSRDGTEERLPLMPKTEAADAILDRVARLIDGR
jgi:phosphopantothenoylcysteine decarboxylase/phosphopantothenate--cysteine ligase